MMRHELMSVTEEMNIAMKQTIRSIVARKGLTFWPAYSMSTDSFRCSLIPYTFACEVKPAMRGIIRSIPNTEYQQPLPKACRVRRKIRYLKKSRLGGRLFRVHSLAIKGGALCRPHSLRHQISMWSQLKKTAQFASA